MTTREKGAITLLVFAVPIFAILMIISTGPENFRDQPKKVPAAATPAKTSALSSIVSRGSSELTVDGVKFEIGRYSNLLVTGTVKNPTSKQFSYVQVEINLYDKEGDQIGSTLANINNLEAGRTWKFEAPVLVDPQKIARAEVKGITAF